MSISLFQQALSDTVLLKAWHKVRSNDSCAGGDGITIERFERSISQNIMMLRQRALAKSYLPMPMRIIDIPKPSGGIRTLSIPSIADRVLQVAFILVLTPIFEPEFEDCSHAYRKGKSVQTAISQIEQHRNDGFTHLIEGDIDDYFNNIPHNNLLNILTDYIQDTDIIHIIALWLDCYNDKGIGLPQGTPIAPLLANIYLDALDEEFSQNNIRIVRFADDFLILCKTKEHTTKTLVKLSQFLKEYGLTLNPEKTDISDFQHGFEFLGHLFARSLVFQKHHDDIIQATVPLEKPIPYIDNHHSPKKDTPEIHIQDNLHLKHRALIVTRKNLRLDAKENNFILYDKEIEKIIFTVPADMPIRIEIGKQAEISNIAIRLAIDYDMPIDFTDAYYHTIGSFLPALNSETSDTTLHLKQADHVLNPQKRFELARIIVLGKIFNQRILLKRLNRNKHHKQVDILCQRLKNTHKKLQTDIHHDNFNINILLGHEGKSTADYYKGLSCLILDPEWQFNGRGDKHNPTHAGSIMINIFSSFLARDMQAVISRTHLHAGFGCLHSTSNVPNALVYDLIEEFRPLLVDSLMIYMMNNRILSPDDFIQSEDGRMTPHKNVYRTLLLEYEKRVNHNITASDGEIVSWRGLMHKQAEAMVTHFKNMSCYQPYQSDY